MSSLAPTIFISYRTEDAQAWAGWIADHLRHNTNAEVLLDVTSLRRGSDYTEAITNQIAKAHAVLVVIGSGWLNVKDSEGNPRLENPDDPVRVEIREALKGDRLVIPILVGGARVPDRSELPQDIAALSLRHGLKLDYDSFDRDLRALVEEDMEQITVTFNSQMTELLPKIIVLPATQGSSSSPQAVTNQTDGTAAAAVTPTPSAVVSASPAQTTPVTTERKSQDTLRLAAIGVVALLSIMWVYIFAAHRADTKSGVSHGTQASLSTTSPKNDYRRNIGSIVAVLNGTPVSALAGQVATELEQAGFKSGRVASASSKSAKTTVVAYITGHAADAEAVAQTLGTDRSAVVPADDSMRAVACPDAATCAAEVIVTVGADRTR